MRSPDLMSEARKWLYELETCEDIERIWPAFDAWFEASEEHRAAYADVRRRWLQLTGVRPYAPRRFPAMPKPLLGRVQEWVFTDRIEWHVFLVACAELLALTLCLTSGVWGIGSSNMKSVLDLLR